MEELRKHSESFSKPDPQNKAKTSNSKSSTDPPAATAQASVSIGNIAAPHGVKGWVKVRNPGGSWSHISVPLDAVLHKDRKKLPTTILEFEVKPQYVLLLTDSFQDPESWKVWTGAEIHIPARLVDVIEREEGEYFYYQLENLEVYDEQGGPTGFHVVRVEETPAHDVLVLAGTGRTILVPFVKQWVGRVSLEEKTIVIFRWEDWLAL